MFFVFAIFLAIPNPIDEDGEFNNANDSDANAAFFLIFSFSDFDTTTSTRLVRFEPNIESYIKFDYNIKIIICTKKLNNI
jgi:hypothetical protein